MEGNPRQTILEIRNLSIAYPISIGTVRAVEDVSFTVEKGEVLGIVGESGCGKSTMGLSILKLMKPPGRITKGEIFINGEDILKMDEKALLELRGRDIAMIFQNPLTSLDPLMSIEDHFLETIRAHEPATRKEEAAAKAEAILESLGIERRRLREYPFQLSGGMRQRIMIGLALILHPKVLIADEPTTSLDVIVEAGFTELLMKLQKLYDLTVILISHNLGLVAEMADRIAVMYGGRIVELAGSKRIFAEPLHPYTRGLLDCIPNINEDEKKLRAMPGSPPGLVNPPEGCCFMPRCPKAMPICGRETPKLVGKEGSLVSCWIYGGEA